MGARHRLRSQPRLPHTQLLSCNATCGRFATPTCDLRNPPHPTLTHSLTPLSLSVCLLPPQLLPDHGPHGDGGAERRADLLPLHAGGAGVGWWR